MKRPDFLHNLSREKKLELVEPSPLVSSDYLKKSADCLRSAKILYENELYDNSITLSYYAMYDSLTALLFAVGIKCENHSGSILLLEELFEKKNLHDAISLAKKERIDKQYYVQSDANAIASASTAKQTAAEAEEFTLEIRLLIGNLTAQKIEALREKFKPVISHGEETGHQ